MNEAPETAASKRPLKSRIRRYLIAGIAIWIPLGVTLFVVQLFAGYAASLVGVLPTAWHPDVLIGFHIPGVRALLGAVMVIMVLLLTGFIASNFLGRHLLQLGNEFLEHIPLVRSIYTAAKQVSDTSRARRGRAESARRDRCRVGNG